VTQADLDEIARKLNDRPRQMLGFRTPAEKLTELIDGLETGTPGRSPRSGLRCQERKRASSCASSDTSCSPQ
jgi:hypothetical protein